MERSEAIEIIKLHRDAMHCSMPNDNYCLSDLNLGCCEDCATALNMAVKSLSQPEIIHCKDCKYYKEFTDSISSKATKGCTLYYVEKDEQGFCDEARKK